MELRNAQFSELHDAKIKAVEIDLEARTVTVRFSHVPFYFRESGATLHTLHGFAMDLLGEATSELIGGRIESNAWVTGGEIHASDGREIDLVEIFRAPVHDVSVDLVTSHGTRLAFRAATLRIADAVPNGSRESCPF